MSGGNPSGEISGLRGEIRSIRSEVSDLRHQVNRVSAIGDRLQGIEAGLARLERQQKRAQDTLNQFLATYQRDRNTDTAYNELTVAERQWQARFGRYEEARDMATSLIDVVASGHLDRSVVLDVTERLAIRTPRYWVAQVTLAIAAWLDDSPDQHHEALSYALALDYEKTSLFMALLLRDQGRDEVLQEWLSAYLSRLTPVSLPRHFQVVIDAATGYALGSGSAPRLVTQVAEWYAEEGARKDTFDAAVGEWKRRLLSLAVRQGRGREFPALAAHEQAWKVLAPRYAASQAAEQAAGYFRGRFETGATVSNDVRADLAELLSKLARTEDDAEEEILHTVREKRAVTLAKGDLSAAEAMFAADEEGRKRTLNIVGMVSQAAFPSPDNGQLPAPTVTELLAILFSKDLVDTAADELRAELPALGLVEITVGMGEWECRFNCGDPARTTRPALRAQAEESKQRIFAQIQQDADRRERLLRWLRKRGTPGGLAAGVGLGAASYALNAPLDLVLPAVAVGVTSLFGMLRLGTVVRRASDRTEAEMRAVSRDIDAVVEELADLLEADRNSGDIHLPALQGYLGGLTQDSITAAIRPLAAVPLPKTRDFPSWTPRPPRRQPEIGDDRGLAPLPGG